MPKLVVSLKKTLLLTEEACKYAETRRFAKKKAIRNTKKKRPLHPPEKSIKAARTVYLAYPLPAMPRPVQVTTSCAHSGEDLRCVAFCPDGSRYAFTASALLFTPAPPDNLHTFLVAGHATKRGMVDGHGSRARFDKPSAMVVSYSPQGEARFVWFVDKGNHMLRTYHIALASVYLAAGSGVCGYSDGPGADASFDGPCGLVMRDRTGPEERVYTFFVLDSMNACVRLVQISEDLCMHAVVSTYVGTHKDARIVLDPNDKLARPQGLCALADGSLVIADTYNNRLCIVTPPPLRAGLLPGHMYTAAGAFGAVAMFQLNMPSAVAVHPTDKNLLYVADTNTHRICRLELPGRILTMVAGVTEALPGKSLKIRRLQTPSDGDQDHARFNRPSALVMSGAGNQLFVLDKGNKGNMRCIEFA